MSRQVIEHIQGRATSDGDGVKLKRIFGGARPQRFDPFLMLDEFGSEEASDYIGGFPPHPHRGFETVTYMLQGKMEHRDHMNNVGLLADGGVQWMTAGRGIIHSEMPQQTEGKMRGFQLWLNLPSEKKMQAARYEDVAPEAIPVYEFEGVTVKALAGQAEIDGTQVQGYFDVPDTEVLYLDVHLAPGKGVSVPVAETHNALVYVYEGQALVGASASPIGAQSVARLGEGENIQVCNEGDIETRVLILAGRPLREPITQYGPFVMNTTEEIEQAINDYRNGTLTDVAV